jgi:phosphatidate cytidylyltransferase
MSLKGIYIYSLYINLVIVTIATFFEFNSFFIYLPILFVLEYAAMPVFIAFDKSSIKQVNNAIFATLYFSWLFAFFNYIQLHNGFGGIAFIGILITVNDFGAYFLGKIFGKHKLCSKLSPNKTIEGAIGGLITTMILSQSLMFMLSNCSRVKVMFLSLLIGILGIIGDLAISNIKRNQDLKDSGFLLPGHGGFLDRFDSWLFTVPVLCLFLAF